MKVTLHLLPALLECPVADGDLAECDTDKFTMDDLNDYLCFLDICSEPQGGNEA